MDSTEFMLHGRVSFFIELLEGYRISKMVTFALLTLTVYEYLITFEQERRYFWTGPWTISRILFLLNRYMLPLVNLLVAYNYAIPSAYTQSCGVAVQLAFIFGVAVMSIIQAALVTRIWYLFSHNRYMQLGIITTFLVSLILGWYFLYMSVSPIVVLESSTKDRFMSGCASTYPERFWRVYIPSLALHTLLYALTVYRALIDRRLLKQTPVLKRLIIDGGFYLFVVFLTVGITSIASLFEEKPMYYLAAVFSPFLPTMISIGLSRVLFGVHSLASNLAFNDSGWLLSDLEPSRAGWRGDSREGEAAIQNMVIDGNEGRRQEGDLVTDMSDDEDYVHIRICIEQGDTEKADTEKGDPEEDLVEPTAKQKKRFGWIGNPENGLSPIPECSEEMEKEQDDNLEGSDLRLPAVKLPVLTVTKVESVDESEWADAYWRVSVRRVSVV